MLKLDPRFRNESCDSASLHGFVVEYATRLRNALLEIDSASLELAHDLIVSTSKRGGRVFAIGNGGSAAIAEHLCCDWTKGTSATGHSAISCIPMASSTSLYSAIANDFGFDHVFSKQLRWHGRKGDVLVAVSSSGNSPNILEAVLEARKLGIATIGMSGFGGGKLRELADISIHAAVNNYGLVEDAHQAAVHILAQYIAHHRDAQ
jgi:D-sedoheptulose 7-phosphate isomerase